MEQFLGYHSEWNLGSPGGWDYQRTTQEIGKAAWQRLNKIKPVSVDLDFDHPLLYPVVGFAQMLVAAHFQRGGDTNALIAVVAEEETLADVTENINLALRLERVGGIKSARQGQFSILPLYQTPDARETQQKDKKLRVVSTVEYFLR